MKLRDLGNVHVSTRAVAQEVTRHLEQRGTPLPDHSKTGRPMVWGMGSSSEHATGRALDFMVEGHTTIGNGIADYLWANRQRLGVKWIIWQQAIRNPDIAGGRWRGMDDRGSATENHLDHVHVFLDGTAPGSTSSPSPSPSRDDTPEPPPFPLPSGAYFGPKSGPDSSVSGFYSHRADLRQWQARMSGRGWQISPDGLYGGQTASIARAFQRDKGLTVDGLIGPVTWATAWTAPIT